MAWKAADLLNLELQGDPPRLYELLAWLREHDPLPVVVDESGKFDPFRVVTRYKDVLEVEKKPEIFTNQPQPILTRKQDEADSIEHFGRPSPIEHLLTMDPPKHTAYRAVTQQWFNPGEVKKLGDTVRKIAREHVERMAEQESLDFCTDVSTWYPLHVILLILGLPRSDEQILMSLTQNVMSLEDPDTLGDRDEMSLVQELLKFMEHCKGIIADRNANPTEDLSSVIANAMIGGEEMSEELKIGYFILIIVAGHDTTKFASAGGMAALLQNPDQLQRLRDQPELLDSAVEEMIRYAAPVRSFLRTVQEDYHLGDTKIAKGERLLLCYNSACRDTSVIDDADQFRIDRDPNRHLAFGHGIHMCLGQHLARLEMKILFEEILGRFSSIELDGKLKGLQSGFVSGYKSVPIRVS